MTISREETQEQIKNLYDALIFHDLISLPPDIVNTLTDEYYSQAIRTTPLSPNTNAVVSLVAPRTAALFADRVWSINPIPVSAGISFGWRFPIEIRVNALFDLYKMDHISKHGEATPLPSENDPYETSEFISELEKKIANEHMKNSDAQVTSLSLLSKLAENRGGRP
jgi:hypothetical protein